jgi:RNA 2',3'-cyclic 3'-phosphodiesterase
MEMVRTFVAVELPADIRKRLADTQAQLRGTMGGAEGAVRWSRTDGVHLTLQFLGDVPSGSIDAILGGVRAGCAGAKPVDLILGSVGAFPTVEKPRVLWLGLNGDAAQLQTLQAGISKKLGALGYQPDKPFKPHITLGRVREHVSKDELVSISRGLQVVAGKSTPHPSFTIHEVSLMKSDLQPAGAVYTALGVVEVGK